MDTSVLLCSFSASGLLYSLLLGLIVCVVYLPRWRLFFRYRNLPPGPFCWPIIGYSGFFDLANIHHTLKAAADKYGGVFRIFIGNRLAVVIDDFDSLKKAYNKDEFLNVVSETMKASTDDRITSIAEINGVEWREERKFWQSSLRYLGLSNQEFRTNLTNQLSQLLDNLKQKEGEELNLFQELDRPINDAASILLSGKPLTDTDYRMQPMFHDMLALGVTNSVKFFFPWSKFFVTFMPSYRKAAKVMQNIENIVRKKVRGHEKTLDVNDPRGFIDLYLLHMQKPDTENVFNTFKLIGNGTGLSLAYVIPIKHHLTWFLLLVAAHPEIQEEIHESLDYIVGRERRPQLEDKPQLPLLESAILETMRYRNLLHLDILRWVDKDTKLNGFDIPKGTVIIHNMTSHLRDPKRWTNPETFDPKRFLINGGKSLSVPEYFIPFSLGKRTCLGEGLALSVMFFYLANILQRFHVLPPKGGVNLDIKFNFMNNPAYPYVRFQERS